jgi:hypothetical protein
VSTKTRGAAQPLNYCTKAIEQFSGNTFAEYPLSRLGMQYIVGKLREAHKFLMPRGGRLLEPNKPRPEVPGLVFHPPFPVVALEYASAGEVWGDETSIYNGSSAPRRISLAWHWTDDFPAAFAWPNLPPAGSGVMVMEISWREELRNWLPGLAAIFMPYEGEWQERQGSSPFVEHMLATGQVTEKALNCRGYDSSIVPILPEMLALKASAAGSFAVAIDLLQADTRDELAAYVDLCYALACKNVSIEKQPAAPALNRARIKAGRMPLFDYHILTLSGDATGEAIQPGTHGSPRPHLRRGHIRHLRHLGPDRITWVNASMVRARGQGFADKDYRVRGQAA